MVKRLRILRLSGRFLSATLAVVLATSPCLANTAESSLWAERRRGAQKATGTSARPTLMASAAMPGRADVGRLLQGLPRPGSASLSPSIANQLSRFTAPDQKKRITDVVRALPAQTGTVREVTRGRSDAGERIVVHIQDIHLNQEAQANIAAAVRELSVQGAAGVVALEGSFGPIDLSPFRAFPDRKAMRAVAEHLTAQHKISGPVGVAMTEEKAPPFLGVDSKEHYDNNVTAYLRSAPLQKTFGQRVRDRERELAEKKRSAYSPELARFDASVNSYDKGQTPLGAYIRLLARNSDDLPISIQSFLAAYDIEKNLDFARVEAERSRMLAALVQKLKPEEIERLVADSLEYRSGRLGHGAFYASLRDLAAKDGVRLGDFPSMDSYVRYVLLTDAIRPQDLYRDIDALRKAGFRTLAVTSEERALVAEDERLNLADKLIHFSLTPEEWGRFREGSREGLAFIGDLSSFETFYLEADARNDALTSNVLAEMDRRKANVGVLVTGGFHAPGVGARFAKAGVSTITYVPRLTKVDVDGTAYLSVFSQEKAPLDQLFEGPRLFLAQNPAPASSLNLGAALASAAAVRNQSVPSADLRTWFRNATGFELRQIESTEGGAFRVVFSRGADGEARIIIRVLDGGGFDVREDAERSIFSRVTDLGARLGRSLTRAPVAAPAPAGAFQTVSLNSTFVLAPLITAAVVGFLSIFGPVSIAIGITVFVLVKITLLMSVVAHEMSHLADDGQLDGKSAVESFRLGFASLNRQSVGLTFLVGTDITNAYVMASPREAALNTEDARRQLERTSRTALAGPAANAFILAMGVGLLMMSMAFSLAGLNDLSFAMVALGSVLSVTNATLLAVNAALGTDFKSWRTGLLVNGRFAALPLGPNDLAYGRSVGPVTFPLQGDTTIQAFLMSRASGLLVLVARTAEGVVVRPQGDAAAIASKESVVLLPGRTVYVGAAPGATIQLTQQGQRTISRFHLAIEMDLLGRVTVRDLFARNGGAFEIRSGAAQRWQTQDDGIDEAFIEQHASLESRSMTDRSLSEIVRPADLIGAPEDAFRRKLRPEELDSQPDRVDGLGQRRDRAGLPIDKQEEIAFLRAFLPILLAKAQDAEQTPAWRDKAAFLLQSMINEAYVLTIPAQGDVAFAAQVLPVAVNLTGRGLQAEPMARVSDTIVTHWLAPTDASNPLRVAVNSTPEGRLLTIAVQRAAGPQIYVDVQGDNKISLSQAEGINVEFVPSVRLIQQGNREVPMNVLTVTLRLDDGTTRVYTATLDPDATSVVFTERDSAARPPAPIGGLLPLDRPEGRLEVERQMDALGGIVLVFNRADIEAGLPNANAMPVREREAKSGLRDGRVQAVSRQGQTFLVWVDRAPTGQTLLVNPLATVAPISAEASIIQRSRVVEALSFVSRVADEESQASGTVQRVRNRFSDALADLAANPVPNTAAQLKFLQGLVDTIAPRTMTSGERARVAVGLRRLFSLRVTVHRFDGRLFVAEDQGSGETIMGINLNDYVGDSFDRFRPDFESRADFFVAAFAAWQQQYGFREEYGGENYDSKRRRAAARFAAIVPSGLARLVNIDGARVEMILATVEILRRLPLRTFERSSDLVNRLRGGIDLAAGRDRAARIGQYRDDIGQLGVQPTVFQFREFLETFLHEFGHVVQARHVAPGSALPALFNRARPNTYSLPTLGFSAEVRRGYIQTPEEMFAETFMHYVLHGELFAQGFPGFTADPAAWRAVYAYYRNTVFAGVEYRNGEPTQPTGRAPFRNAALNSTFVLAPAITAIVAGIAALFAPVSLPTVLLIYGIAKVALFVSVVVHELAHLTSDGQIAGKSPGEILRLGLDALNRENLVAAFITGADITNAFVVASPLEAAQNAEDAERQVMQTSRTALAGPLANVALALLGFSVMAAAGLMAVLGYGDASTAAALLGGVLAATNVVIVAVNAVNGTDFETWRTGMAAAGDFRAFGRRGQAGEHKDKDFGNGKAVTGVAMGDDTVIQVTLPGRDNLIVQVKRREGGIQVKAIGEAARQALKGGTLFLQPGQSAYVGAGPATDMTLSRDPGRKLSRYHVIVDVDDEGLVTVRDLFSTNGARIIVQGAVGTFQTEQGAPDEKFIQRHTTAASRSMADVSLVDFRLDLASIQRAARGQDAPLPQAVLDRQEGRVNALPTRTDLPLANDRSRRLMFLRAYIPILLVKSRDSTEGIDDEEAVAWARETSKYLEILLNEAESLTRAPGDAFTPAALPSAVRVGSEMTTEPQSRRSGDVVTHWLAPRSAANPMRVAINTTPQGQLMTLAIERRVGEREYMGVDGESAIPLAGAVDVAVEYAETERAVGSVVPANSLQVTVRYADGTTRRFTAILNPALTSFNLVETTEAAPAAPSPDPAAGVVFRGLTPRGLTPRGVQRAVRPVAPEAPAQEPVAAAEAPAIGVASRRAQYRDDKARAGESTDLINEDTTFQAELPGGIIIAGVMDGMGGSYRGEDASRTAGQVIARELAAIRPGMPEDRIEDILRAAIRLAHETVRARYPGAGTTATVLVLVPRADGPHRAFIGNAADSRAYLQTPAGLRMLTVDNDQAGRVLDLDTREGAAALQKSLDEHQQEQVSRARTRAELQGAADLMFNIRHYVFNHLGTPEGVNPAITKITVPAGGRVVLVSDGVYDHLVTDEIRASLTGTPEQAAARSVDAAYQRSLDKSNFRTKTLGDDATALVVEARAGRYVAPDSLPASAPVEDIAYERVQYQGTAVIDRNNFNGPITLNVAGFQMLLVRAADGGYVLSLLNDAGMPSTGLETPLTIPEGGATVGRASGSTVRIDNTLISGRQLTITVDDAGRALVRDLGRNDSSPERHSTLTLPFTRDIARALGLNPDGLVTEVVVAPIVEGVIPLHFLPFFPLLHSSRSWLQWIGMGMIYGVAALMAFGFGTGYADSTFYVWIGGMIGHSLYNLLARAFGWKSLTLDSLGQRVENAVLGAAAGNLGAHFSVNVLFSLVDKATGWGAAWTGRTPEARVGEALISAAMAVAARRGRVDVDQLMGVVVPMNIGRAFVGNRFAAGVAPAALNREGVMAYVRENLAGRLRAGDLSFTEAQRVAEKLSTWLGESVTVANRNIVSAARPADAGNLLDLLTRRPDQKNVTIIVEAANEAEFRRIFAAQIAAGRVAIVASAGALFSEGNRINAPALESALSLALDAPGLSNALLVLSHDVSFETAELSPGSLLSQIRYKALEDLLNNLPELKVLPLGDVIRAARVLAVQA